MMTLEDVAAIFWGKLKLRNDLHPFGDDVEI